MIDYPALAVALDLHSVDAADRLAARLDGVVDIYKVGLELLAGDSRDALVRLGRHGPVFCDAKLHDIPRTAGAAARELARYGVAFLTIHLSGGVDMARAALEGAREGAASEGIEPPVILGVTVLTSLDSTIDDVCTWAEQGAEAGVGGIVCAPNEVAAVRSVVGDLICVTPGIRPVSASSRVGTPAVRADDQARTSTPEQALRAGADILVVGRPITQARDPRARASEIAQVVIASRSVSR